MANLSANWVLAAYMDANARPGVILDLKSSQEALARLHQRARFEALLRGVFDQNVVEEAVSSMMAWVAGSRISERAQTERGTPRQYINKVIARFVQKEIARRWRQDVDPLHDKLESKSIDPALAVEICDRTEECRRRLGPGFGRYVEKGSPDEPANRRDVRRHRHRERQWKAVSDLFEERQRGRRRRCN